MTYRENAESKEQAYERGFIAGQNELLSEARRELRSDAFLFVRKFGFVFGICISVALFISVTVAVAYYATSWISEGLGIGVAAVVGAAAFLSLVIGGIMYIEEKK